MKTNRIQIQNKKAYHDYFIEDMYISGIILTGTEIKSIREGKASLVDTFCYIHNGEIWLKNSYIAPYINGSFANHAERRERKLLLTKREINKINIKSKIAGYTIVPLKMFINEHGLCKVEVAICKGKKEYDKRETIKEKDSKREIDRALKQY